MKQFGSTVVRGVAQNTDELAWFLERLASLWVGCGFEPRIDQTKDLPIKLISMISLLVLACAVMRSNYHLLTSSFLHSFCCYNLTRTSWN